MNIGVYFAYWTQEWDVNYLPYIDRAATLGFDVLEIGALGLVNLSDEQLLQLKEAATKAKITITAGIGLPPQYDVSSSDKKTRQDGIAFMKRILDAMHTANIKIIGGTIYSYWPVDYTLEINKEQALNNSINSIQEIADYASQYDILLGIEVLNRFEQFLINTVLEAKNYIQAVGRTNVKIMLDTFHMNIEEDDMIQAIHLAGKDLGHFHIGESNRKVPELKEGNFQWISILNALKDIQYNGHIVMEPFLKKGGTVGRDIKVWRDLSNDASEKQLDKNLIDSTKMLRKILESK